MQALANFGPRVARAVNLDLVIDTTNGARLWVISMLDLEQTRAQLKPMLDTLPTPSNNTLTEME